MKNFSLIFTMLIVFISTFLLVGCKTAAQPTTDLTLKVTETVTSTSSAVVGTVKNTAGDPLVDVSVKLAVVVWNADKTDGAFFLEPERGPTTGTKEDGSFAIVNITPNEYVLVVGDPMGSNEVIQQPNSKKPVIYKLEAGKVLDVGELRVNITP